MTADLAVERPGTTAGWRPGEGPVQFVRPDGTLTAQGTHNGVDIELARMLFRDMARARRLDQEALALQRQGELGLWLQCWGQEAAQVGSIRALAPEEHVFPSYREHAAALVRGVSPAELLAQWRGVAHAGWDPSAHHFHFYSLVLGTQTLHATGYAMGSALAGDGELVAVYFGDGAASQGDVSEAFNWASARNLPILFFCQNNQWAISTSTDLQYRSPVHERAAGFGLATFHVDGNDALATHAVTSTAAELVRSGDGPALVEAETFRMAGHSTSDDPTRYRTEAELERWRARDPLARLETLLRSLDTPADFFSSLDQELEELATEVRRACRELPEPHLGDLFDTAYATPHALVDADRRAYRAFAAIMAEEN